MTRHARDDVPEEGLISLEFELVGFVDEEGEMRYVTRVESDAQWSTLFGLLDMARADLHERRNES